jgi:multicomponent Na+:H+ antiporter subunit G
MNEIAVALVVLVGAFFMVVAALGVLRMPDLLTRMHASTKAGTLGATMLIVAVALAFRETSVTVRCLAIVVFLCLTAPVVAQVIGRVGYFELKVRLWKGTIVEVPQDDPDGPQEREETSG